VTHVRTAPRPPGALLGAAAVLAFGALIQLLPYGHAHTNPPAGAAPAWDSPRTLALARRACFDCHSNSTRWPWYASIAPLSWRIEGHVDRGRRRLDFTSFEPADAHVAHAAGEAADVVEKDEMPPQDYRFAHPEARLTASERRELAAGLRRTFAAYALRRD